MILYLDTSAYVRLYVREAGHDAVWMAAQVAAQITSHLIAYTEMRAALARMQRMKRLSGTDADTIKKVFETDWNNTFKITPTEDMIRRAGDLAEQFGLRGYDSVHLAAAESLMIDRRHVVSFASFDRALNEAAVKLGLQDLGDAPSRR